MDRMDILFHFILLDRGEYIIMYKVMKIINYMATRDVVLRNLETGTEDSAQINPHTFYGKLCKLGVAASKQS